MHLTNLEKETIINFNEAETEAVVYTYNGKMKKNLRQLAQDRPEAARLVATDNHGGETFTVPKTWVKLRAPRILSEAQKEVLENARKSYRNAAGADDGEGSPARVG